MCSPMPKLQMTHSSLLFERLLNLRDCPFTLILDSLEQSGIPIIKEFGRRAENSNTKIVFVSFTTPCKKKPFKTSIFISARREPLNSLQRQILSHLTVAKSNPSAPNKYLVIIDSLIPLASSHPEELPSFLTSILTSPTISLLAIYHIDVPMPLSNVFYMPQPILVLTYLATAILTVSSLAQTLSCKVARDRSQQEPVFGLDEQREGVLIGLTSPKKNTEFVVNMESRRRSGRAIVEKFVFMPSSSASAVSNFILLNNHPVYASAPKLAGTDTLEVEKGFDTTFNLELTEKQKRDREEVVLPYFDAQRENGNCGPGEGGRILYQLGVEDHEDFDEEEDEI